MSKTRLVSSTSWPARAAEYTELAAPLVEHNFRLGAEHFSDKTLSGLLQSLLP